MRLRRRLVPLALLPLVVASCGVPIVSGSRFGAGVEPSAPLTFFWNQDRDLVMGDSRLENNSFFEDRLHEAVEWELSLRGFRRTADSPDLLVHHHLSLADHDLVEEIIDQDGMSRTEVYSVEEGTVTVHMVDARTGQTFWVGFAQADIEAALRGPNQMETWVYGIVRRMFSNWPVPARAE
jgi:hypothetical protein